VPHRLLAVHAHPDDESLTMAGTLAGAVRSGAQVTLLTATLGEQGEVIGDELAGLVADRADQLGGYRLAELKAACRALRIKDQRVLGGIGAFRDSGMAGEDSAEHPKAFIHASRGGPDHDRVVDMLIRKFRVIRPDVVLTYDADGGYGHPDHIAVHQVTVEAATTGGWRVPRVLGVVRPRTATAAAFAAMTVPKGYYTVDADYVGPLAADADVAVAVPVAPHERVRLRALAAHKTQVTLLKGGFALSNLIAQPLPDTEYFRLLAGEPVPLQSGGSPAADVFAGLG
jgi:N-acetyl-1-D-myo-inositol-2-amino-2-deoxy-alpha-D-glucopyranoside deacetylase